MRRSGSGKGVCQGAPSQAFTSPRSRALRGADTHEYVFLLNHSGEPTALGPIGTEGTDLLTGTLMSGHVELEPLGAAAIQRATP